MLILRVRVDVCDVLDGATEDCTGRRAAPAGRHGITAPHGLDPLGRESVMGHEVEQLSIEPKEVAELGRAESARARDDRIEDRLNVRRRARDDLQYLASRRLPVERVLRLVEQSDVLDGDNGLVGEALEKPDMRIGERPYLSAADDQSADGGSLLQQRHTQYGPDSLLFNGGPDIWPR